MRDSLRRHLRRQVRRGRVRSLAGIGIRAAAARFEVRLPAPLRGPLLATFAITYRCPLSCAMCDLPARARGEIPDEEVPRWIDAIADLRPAGVGFTGGEPLLREATLPAIEQAAARGLVTHLNTSGYGLTEVRAHRLVRSGVASINVSVDHDDASAHDAWRGLDGGHARALAALRRLADAREDAGADLRLQVVMAVSTENQARVEAVEAQARAAGADALSLLPVHDFEAARGGADRPPSPPGAAAPARIPASIENSARYADGIAPFLAGGPTPGPCSAPTTGLFVDPRGHLFACTPGATFRDGGIPATPETLGTIARSGRLRETVPEGLCDRCWWNCHRELDIAIGRG